MKSTIDSPRRFSARPTPLHLRMHPRVVKPRRRPTVKVPVKSSGPATRKSERAARKIDASRVRDALVVTAVVFFVIALMTLMAWLASLGVASSPDAWAYPMI